MSNKCMVYLDRGKVKVWFGPDENRFSSDLQTTNMANKKMGIMVLGVSCATGQSFPGTVKGHKNAELYRCVEWTSLTVLGKNWAGIPLSTGGSEHSSSKNWDWVVCWQFRWSSVMACHIIWFEWYGKSLGLISATSWWTSGPAKKLVELNLVIKKGWETVVIPELCQQLYASIPIRIGRVIKVPVDASVPPRMACCKFFLPRFLLHIELWCSTSIFIKVPVILQLVLDSFTIVVISFVPENCWLYLYDNPTPRYPLVTCDWG